VQERVPRDWFGSAVGLAIFLAGIGLLAFTFYQAYLLFEVPPRAALGMKDGQPIDFSNVSASAFALISRILLMIVMAAVGSVIANRGIAMYSRCRSLTINQATKTAEE
jgi:hypothetical protein